MPFNINFDKADDKYKTRESSGLPSQEDGSQSVNVDYIKIQTILRVSRLPISNSKLAEDIKQIEKDIERTGYVFDDLDKDPSLSPESRSRIVEALRNVLITFAAFHQNVEDPDAPKATPSSPTYNLGYTQGYLTILQAIDYS